MADLGILFALIRSPQLLARLRLRRQARTYLRLQFLGAAIATDLLPSLRARIPADRLAERIGAADLDLLRTFLDLGVALGELDRTSGSYRLSGRMARALAGPGGEVLQAAVTELVDYHGTVYRDFDAHLRGGTRGDYLAGRGELIAASSRLVEPALGAFVRALVQGSDPLHILEIGCGSGTYLRHAAVANPRATGVGIDLQPAVVTATADALARWGIAERFHVRCADARDLPGDVDGDFDLITLYNNIYYIEPEQRSALFARLRERLSDGGRLAVASMMRGSTFTSLDLSLVLATTAGCTPLPDADELTEDLRCAGFGAMTRRSLLPGEPYLAIVANR